MNAGAFQGHLGEQEAAHESDQKKCGLFEYWKFFNQPDAHACEKTQGKDSDEDACANDPEPLIQSDRRHDIVQAQRQVHHFDLENGADETRFVVVSLGLIGGFVLAHDI
jgi:hypothetical protein